MLQTNELLNKSFLLKCFRQFIQLARSHVVCGLFNYFFFQFKKFVSLRVTSIFPMEITVVNLEVDNHIIGFRSICFETFKSDQISSLKHIFSVHL